MAQQLTNSRLLATERSEIRAAFHVGQPARARLLVVEDSADGAALLGKVLESVGYSVNLAIDAAEALRLAEAESFDLVISDVGLPGMDGFELMAELRDRRSLRGIALTGFAVAEDIERGQKAGFSEYLVKPVDIAQLDAAIRRVLKRRTMPLPN